MTSQEGRNRGRRLCLVIRMTTMVCLVLGSFLRCLDAADPAIETIAEPVSPQTQRARELIYLLRQYRVFSRDEEWAQTIRELVEIGKPAVPELIAELDRTDRNSTIRSLGFALRAIGDSQAVPALIRAIPKTRGNQGSDCGVSIRDPELRSFMRKHQNHPQSEKDQSILRGRPVNEVVTALEKLTGHPVPYPKEGQDDRRERWLGWWKEHQHEYPLDGQVPVVAAVEPADDPVERAGVTKFGPLFPTGSDWQLGPIHEVTLDLLQYANGKAFFDFETGQLFEIREGRKPANSPTPESADLFLWETEHGIDVRNNGYLDSSDLNAWLIEDHRWDTLEDEIRSGERIGLGRETTTHLEPFGNHASDFKNDCIGTFLFTTHDGGRGILQVFPERGDRHERRLRYRMFESTINPRVLPAEKLDRPSEKTPLGKIVTVTLPLAAVNAECLLDLETGQTYPLPKQFEKAVSNPNEIFHGKDSAEWSRQRGIDVIGSSFKINNTFGGGEESRPPRTGLQLLGREMKAVRLLPKSFYRLGLEEVQELLDRDPYEQRGAWMSLQPTSNDDVETYAIRTSDGTIGLIKLEQVPDDPQKILIRYRLGPAGNKSP